MVVVLAAPIFTYPVPADESKNHYDHNEMMERLKRSRSAGYSASGQKLKRRSVQPHKVRQTRLKFMIGFAVVAVIALLGLGWFLFRDYANQHPKAAAPASGLFKPMPAH